MPRRAAAHHAKVGASVLAALTVTALAATGSPAFAAPAGGHSMNQAFARAAAKFDVPRDLLAAVGYGETHLDGHSGRPSQANGYGVMHLVSNPTNRTLEQAAALTGEPLADLRTDTAANIMGGAAVLRGYADKVGLGDRERDDVNAWYPAVARYSGSTGHAAALYADTVYTFLAHGLHATVPGGEQISVTARPVSPHKGSLDTTDVPAQSPDYPSAVWVPAHAENFAVGRSAKIDKVIIHVTQGSYAGSISWFQNPTAEVSAHYVVRSSDGRITQMVRDRDTAYHARGQNASALGIEHEGFVDDPSWFTDTMYRSSAALTKHLCDRYGIPKDRAHIIGHNEAAGSDHTDPGRYWDWTRYMQLVGGDTGGGSSRDGLDFTAYAARRSGSTGAQVKAVQRLLGEQGYVAGAVDGSSGSATLTAVRTYQASRGLTADGIVGPGT
ncbi:N-acetylmuramoyl-L-alanine amidase [Streptomyces sp. NPDC018000]|uniref:N-acetylmuramoyl-L-alanine amidase n=1 Tax=Streptomyces sp. NPDC018000 TaxID=3365028 RepID=UPI003796E37C